MGLFRRQTQCITIILLLLIFIASGTCVFAEEFSGVGLILQGYKTNLWVHPKTGQALKPPTYEYFVSPIPDSPAKRAGMPELAKLIAIDGQDVENMDLDTVVGRIQGHTGSVVVLRVIVEETRDGRLGRYIKEYSLIRERIVIPN